MRILFLSAEAAPFVTVGGLSQVMYFLPRALRKRGHDVRVFTPRYGSTDRVSLEERWKTSGKPETLNVPINSGPESIECVVQAHRPKDDGDPWAYLLDNKEYYELRANVFGYADDHVRFALLSKACLEWLRAQNEKRTKDGKEVWWPDVVHCHDWHTSYFIDYARRDKRYQAVMARVPALLTVHNFKYQGNGDFKYVPDAEKDDGKAPLAPLNDDLLKKQNALKRGLMYADAITTVSPTHAREVLTAEYAEGLLDTLEENRGKLSGILNGIDTEELDPAIDPIVKRKFSRRWFASARQANKKDLQEQFSLPTSADAPLFGYVGRLTQQKGLDLLIESVPHLLEARPDAQFIAVGGGDERFRTGLEELKTRFPEQVGLHLMPDFRLPRKVFSGVDMILIPSLFEPGGIVALEALRYGAVPVVRRTGGLNDSIEDFDAAERRGNGFSFDKKDAWAMYGTLVEALTIHRQPSVWEKLVSNCLNCDFSWGHAAEEYEDWYGRALRQRQPRRPNVLRRAIGLED